MRIIFVDIDGVILPIGAIGDRGIREILEKPFDHLDLLEERVSKPAVRNLIELADTIDAKFVMISSWRGLFEPEFIQAFMQRIGLFNRFHEHWEAPMRGFPPRPVKGADIGRWLVERRVAQKHCIVIDDEDLMLRDSFGFYVLKQVKPQSKIGFSRDDLARAIAIVRKQDPEGLTPATSSA